MLYILPNLLGENISHEPFFPPIIPSIVRRLDGIIAESQKGALCYLKRFHQNVRQVPIHLLNEHTKSIDPLLAPLQKGETWGLISDAGLPILADPGAFLVRRLHHLKIPIKNLPGPSSIVYALQLSGLSGQKFTFHGYPPHAEKIFKEKLRTLPKGHTHIFIEAPYRSDKLLQRLVRGLQKETDLSVSWNLSLSHQHVRTDSIAKWQADLPTLGKVPAVFIIYSKKS